MQISGALSLCSFFLSGTLSPKFCLSLPELSLCFFFSVKFCLRVFLCYSPEISSRQKAWVIIGFEAFVSYTVQHHLFSHVWKQLFHIFLTFWVFFLLLLLLFHGRRASPIVVTKSSTFYIILSLWIFSIIQNNRKIIFLSEIW